MKRNRVLALLEVRNGVRAEDLTASLSLFARNAVSRVRGDDVRYRVSLRVPRSNVGSPPTTYDGVVDRGLSSGVKLGGISAVLEVSAPEGASLDDLAGCLDGVAAAIGDTIDVDQSTAVVGTDVVILDGGGEVQLFYCMPRAAGLSHDDFCRYWAEEHTKISVFTPGLAGYRQLHVSLEHSHKSAAAAGLAFSEIDGVALEWFPTMDDFVGAVGAPAEFGESAKASEEEFNRIAGVKAVVATVVDCGRDSCDTPW